ncbi:MAG TPA: CDP-diacylglycerol--glycerol-3-phosphate 3-phosphatidyltransferase [Desulfobulbaceae bacterium]|nr:CDP-diacylglycerol--glycerol-3-phosphate 3-phosphatidyltransferase [Desulfobulbaceae bacterium]
MNPILNLPNTITAVRFFLAALLAIMLMVEQTMWFGFLTWIVFTVAASSDWVDGYFARRYKSETVLGRLMDPLADKVLVTTALIMLIPLGRLPAWVALLILCREMIITGLRGIAATTGIVVSASGMGKIKSIIQYIGVGTLIFPLDLLPLPFLHRLGLMIVYVSLVVAIWSGIDYFLKLKDLFLSPPASR